jgi:phosphohistidine phosphatase SixA
MRTIASTLVASSSSRLFPLRLAPLMTAAARLGRARLSLWARPLWRCARSGFTPGSQRTRRAKPSRCSPPISKSHANPAPQQRISLNTILFIVVGLALLAGVAPASAQSAQGMNATGDMEALAQALRAGGYAIVVRHGATFSNQADTDPFNLADVGKQRNLNDKGKELAKAFGVAIRAAGLPIGKVYTSQFNRAYETAVLAGFKNIKTMVDLSEGGLVVTPDENNRRAQALRRMLATVPNKGENDILITHKPNIIDALGKDWFDVREGEASIFKPEGGKYRLIARLQMEDWPKLASLSK